MYSCKCLFYAFLRLEGKPYRIHQFVASLFDYQIPLNVLHFRGHTIYNAKEIGSKVRRTRLFSVDLTLVAIYFIILFIFSTNENCCSF